MHHFSRFLFIVLCCYSTQHSLVAMEQSYSKEQNKDVAESNNKRDLENISAPDSKKRRGEETVDLSYLFDLFSSLPEEQLLDTMKQTVKPFDCPLLKLQDVNANSLLHYAVRAGYRSIITFLLAKHNFYASDHGTSYIDLQNHRGFTALHCAVLEGKKEIVAMLLLQGNPAILSDQLGNTPIDYVGMTQENSDIELVQPLVQHYKRKRYATEYTRLLYRAMQYNQTSLLEALLDNAEMQQIMKTDSTFIHWAMIRHHDPFFNKLLALGASLNNKVEKSTLLHIALNHKSQQENLHKLLQNENLDLHQKDTQGKTPLYVAIEQHYPDIVTFLLDHDVSVLGNMSRADLRKTPLFYALLAGYRDMVVLLLKRPDIFIDLGGSMVDTLASMYKQTNNDRMLSMVRLLLLYGGGFDKKDAVVMAALNKLFPNPLWIAVITGCYEDVGTLLQDPVMRAELTRQDEDKATLLMYAAGQGHDEIVSLLLEAGSPLFATTIDHDNVSGILDVLLKRELSKENYISIQSSVQQAITSCCKTVFQLTEEAPQEVVRTSSLSPEIWFMLMSFVLGRHAYHYFPESK